MKKETGIAISAGVLAGVIIAVFLITNSRGNVRTGVNSQIPTISPAITIPQEKLETFRVTEPKDMFVTRKNEITIKGEAPKGTTVVLQSPKDAKVIKTDSPNFQTNFTLSHGENVIAASFYYNKNTSQQITHVYYIENE